MKKKGLVYKLFKLTDDEISIIGGRNEQ